MGSSKTEQYSRKQLLFARTAKAIAHPARIAIVQHLAEFGVVTNGEIIRFTKLTDGTIAQHLRELVYCGILIEIYIGNIHYYKLATDAEEAVKSLQLLFMPANEED